MYSIKVLVVSIAALSILVQVASSAPQKCHCVASDSSCWPSSKEWDTFNNTIAGRLIAPKPTGYSCHSPHYDATTCANVRANYTNAYMRGDNSGSMQADNWEDDGDQRCAFEAPKSTACYQGRVSVLGVEVENVSDIQKAIKFASSHNLRIAVKSSGHDYLGRSAAVGSFLIWMHNFKKTSIDHAFTAAAGDGDCAAAAAAAQAAITIVGGVMWGEVYSLLKPTDYTIIGGQCLTICATGGYVQGGGHSSLSPSFGLAIDNVLQIEVVTADGKLHTVNACRDPELFFALRGGGGGTFGVVTSVTYKLHKIPDNLTGVFFTFSPAGNSTATWTTATQEEVMTVWLQNLATLDAKLWGGFWLFGPAYFTGYFIIPTTKEAANATITPIMEALLQIQDVNLSSSKVVSVANFLEWHVYTEGSTGTDPTGGRHLLGSRIIPYSALQNPSAMARHFVTALSKIGISSSVFMYGLMVIGPGVRNGDPHGDTAVSPSWRKGILHTVAVSQWTWNSTETAARTSALEYVKTLREAYPDSGAYMNEASIDEPSYQQSFWGTKNYAKLVAIKMRVDPSGLFVCKKCVGSDVWDNSTATCRDKF